MTQQNHSAAEHNPGPSIPTHDRAFWEERYAGPGFAWSGNPNPVLVAEAGTLTPGRALDIGSGEGGDALWLAARGWRVTGVDISQNALDRARARVTEANAEAAERIEWRRTDLTAWTPTPRGYDLVTAQFMHLPAPLRTVLFRALAEAVAPGGTLLIVGHDAGDITDPPRPAEFATLMFSAEDVAADIAGSGLLVEIAERRARALPSAGGQFLHDAVLRAGRPTDA